MPWSMGIIDAMPPASSPSPRLLLVPSFTELEWGIRGSLEDWAEVATFDAPGIGDTGLPFEVQLDPGLGSELLARWAEGNRSARPGGGGSAGLGALCGGARRGGAGDRRSHRPAASPSGAG